MEYMLLADVEEVAEMMGMILFAYALLNYLSDLLANRVTHESAS